MKKHFLFIALALSLLANYANAEKKTGDEVQRKSDGKQVAGTGNPSFTTFPQQFIQTDTTRSGVNRAVSTGYYFVDSDDRAPDYWLPNEEFVDTLFQPITWRRILAGPRIVDSTYWDTYKEEGLRFFRNPAQRNFFQHRDALNNIIVVDSTDNAIAGPIPIGFGFYFNGIRYDSFYVSTNGVIALTNRRYYYNSNGERTIPPGATNAYDPMSMDWFVRTSRTATGLDDTEADDFGYRFSVLNNQPTVATAGIRSSGGPLHQQSTAANKGAFIAPFWGPLCVSQFSARDNRPDDHGKVYYKREVDGSKLTVWFVNMNINPGPQTLNGSVNYTVLKDRRPGDLGYLRGGAQVVLNRMDSSITFIYKGFDGQFRQGNDAFDAKLVFGFLTTAGVTGWARDAAYNSKTGVGSFPWGPTSNSEYQQSTHYFNRLTTPTYSELFPAEDRKVRFKQWKNSLRVVDIQYRVRDENTAATDMSFSKVITTTQAANYELLASEPKLGALQPIALIQNMSNDIQGPYGVNFVPQDAVFVARFRIINLATYDIDAVTKKRLPVPRVVYNRFIRITQECLNYDPATMPVNSNCGDDPYTKVRLSSVTLNNNNFIATNLPIPLASSITGIPPYQYVQVSFPPFEPNQYTPDHIGRMRAFVVSDAQASPDPTKPAIGGDWPFDDTTSVDFIVMKRLHEFSDDFTEFHSIFRTNYPSVYKWVNVGATISDGDTESSSPLPPNGLFSAMNFTDMKINSPVLLVNRKDVSGADWSPNQNTAGGDIVTSFPIDMRNKRGAVLSFSVQRTKKSDFDPTRKGLDRGWSDDKIWGVEGRLVSNQNKNSLFNDGRSVHRPDGDSIVLEFMRPTPDGIKFVTNVSDYNRWRWHPVPKTIDNPNPAPLFGMPAFALFGMGGYFVGWDEKNPNNPLKRDPTTNENENGLRYNMFDDGIDDSFQKFSIQIPDSFILAPNDGAKNFRFRFRVVARNHNKGQGGIIDDDDDFLLDNVRIQMPTNKPDLEVSSVKALWQYELAPASQATDIPIRVTISNNTEINSSTLKVKVKIFKGLGTWGDPVYCRVQEIPNLNARRSLEVTMPTWNAKRTGADDYRLQAIVIYPGGDAYNKNDTTYTNFKLVFGSVFAYDNPESEINNVPDFTGVTGSGLSLSGAAFGGTDAANGATYMANPIYTMGGNGLGSGSSSGQFAAKFTLLNTDTIYGFQALFGNLNQAMNDISFSIYLSNPNENLPGILYPATTIYAKRGFGSGQVFPEFNKYLTYRLQDYNRQPVILNKGTYWVTIAQMGIEGLHLGGSSHRMGMRTTSEYRFPNAPFPWGNGGACHLMIDKQYRKYVNGELVNNNFFAFEDVAFSGSWTEFMKTNDNPAFAHLDHRGNVVDQTQTLTFSRGTFIPMVRPFFGIKDYELEQVVQICTDDIPVELMNFRGDVRANVGIDLHWETASETNNYGFYVERRMSGEGENDWQTIGFKEGANNSNTIVHYNFTDRNVKLNNTYQYRLRQTDLDGTQYCSSSDVVTQTFDMVDELTVLQNSPNPFNNYTVIEFNMPSTQKARLEIVDLYGNVVKVLTDGEMQRGLNTVVWDGTNANGTTVPSGTYIYRVSSGSEIVSGKMTFIK